MPKNTNERIIDSAFTPFRGGGGTTIRASTPGNGGGGGTYVGGVAISILGTTINLDLASPSGLTIVGDKLALADTVAGNGLSMSASKVMAINLTTPYSGLEIISDALRIRDDLAGAGLAITNKIMSIDLEPISGLVIGSGATGKMKVDTGRGLDFAPAGNQLEVNEAFAFQWTGVHTFAANINISGDRTITSTANSDLIIDLGTGAAPGTLYLADDQRLRSIGFDDGIPIVGFDLFQTPMGKRQLTIANIKVDELHARAFVADTVRVDVGEEWWGKSMGLLWQDFTTPASINGTATMILEDSPALDGQLFSANDWVMLRQIQLPAPGVVGNADIAYIWGQVSGYVNLAADDNGIGRQQWTFTLRSGPTNATIKKGAVVVDFGVSGQGFIHLSALDSAQGPWLRVSDWSGANPYTVTTEHRYPRTQMGRLDVIDDPDLNPTGWGFYSDNAYLRGQVRTAETILNDDGLYIEQQEIASMGFSGHARIGWKADVNDTVTEPIYQITSWTNTSATPDTDNVVLALNQRSTSGRSLQQFVVSSLGVARASISLRSWEPLNIFSTLGIEMGNSVFPDAMDVWNLGSPSRRWDTLYVKTLEAGSISSGGSLSGNKWESTGNLTIDAESSSNTTVFVVNEGTGTVTLDIEGNLTLDGTVDGVDVSGLNSTVLSHIANVDIHHSKAEGGAGITVDSASQLVSVRRKATDSGLSVAGNELSVVVKEGIEIDANALRVDEGFGFTWSALHTHSANIHFTGGNTITSASILSLSPTGDLRLDAGSNLINVMSAATLQSANHASQVTGWGIDYAGGADFRNLFVDELHAKSFIVDLEQALAGGQIISKSVAVIAVDFTIPAAGVSAPLTVEDLPSAPGMAVFVTGDIIRLRQFSRSGGGLTIANAWGAVSAYADNTDGTQTWTYTRSTAPNTGSASGVVAAKSLALDYGTTGNGYYEVNAIDGVYAANSPYSQIVTWTGHPHTGQVVRVRMGNLAGVGFADEYGLYARGAQADHYLKASGSGLLINNADVNIVEGTFTVGDEAGDQFMHYDPATGELTVQGTILLPGGDPLPVAEDYPFLEQTDALVDSDYDGLMMNANFLGFYQDGEAQTFIDAAGDFMFGASAAGHQLRWNRLAGRLSGSTHVGGGVMVEQWYADIDQGGKLFAGGGHVGLSQDGLLIDETILAAGAPEKGAVDPGKVSWWPDIDSITEDQLPRAEVWAYKRAGENLDTLTGLDPIEDYDVHRIVMRSRSYGAEFPETAASTHISANAYTGSEVSAAEASGTLNPYSPIIAMNGIADRMGQISIVADRDAAGVDARTQIELWTAPDEVLGPASGESWRVRRRIRYRADLHDFWVPDYGVSGGQHSGYQFHLGNQWLWWVGREDSGIIRMATSGVVESWDFGGLMNAAEIRTGQLSVGGVPVVMAAEGEGPEARTVTANIGSALEPFTNVYAENIHADTVTIAGGGGIPLSGSTWQYDDGNMTIKSNSASDRTLLVVNQDAGVMHLFVGGDMRTDGNVVLDTPGATVDGVDLSAFKSAYDAYVATAYVPAARTVTAGSGLTGGGALSGNITLNVGAGTGIVVATDTIAVDFAEVVPAARTVTAGAGLSGGGALSGNITLNVGAGDGIDVLADTIAVDATVLRSTRSVIAGTGMTGGGALSSNVTLNVIGGDGIVANADDIAVDSSVVRTSRTITAGNGLTGGGDLSANRSFAVGQGDGIFVGATDVRISLHANSGLEFSGGALRLGLPTTLDVATTNLVTGNTHAHDIDSSADVGTTPVSKILHSTSAGGLILGTLNVKGAVTITDGGEFTVGPNILYVNNTSDPSTSHVGINWVGDPQFALDVNGPIRGQYLVGPHALQVKDVTLLSHFDGKEPYHTNSTGDPNSTMGQVGVPQGTLVFRPGKFFKALEIAQAATNLIANPQFDAGSTSGWTDYATGTAGGTRVTFSTTETYIGEYSYRVHKTAGADADNFGTFTTFAVTSGLAYTASVWLFLNGMTGGLKRVHVETNTNVTTVGADLDAGTDGTSGGWVRVSVTTTATATGTARLYVWIDDATSGLFYLSAVQVTQTAYAQPYIQTTRTANGLVYRGVYVNWAKLTVMAWIHPAATASVSGIIHRVMTLYKDATNFYALNYHTTDTLRLATTAGNIVISSATITGATWTHVAVTIGGGTATLYINGVAAGSGAIASHPSGTLPDLYVGVNNGFANQLNGLIDDVVLVDRTLPAKEILSIVESNAPVFAETGKYSARFTTRGLGWFDDEGLWMKDHLGGEVMGFYGGEAANKSWGGKTLNTGDILFGKYGASDGGWLYFDRDGVSSAPYLSLGYADKTVLSLDKLGATLDGYLDISTAGGIYQGDGNPATSSWGTGLRIWNSGGIGRLSTYNANVEQITLTSLGKLTAGAGAVALDSDGITITQGSGKSNRIEWMSGATAVAQAVATVGGSQNIFYLTAQPLAASTTILELESKAISGQVGQIELRTWNGATNTGALTMGVSGSSYAVMSNLTGSKGVLGLSQGVNAQAMLDFSGATAGAGTSQNFSTDAVGTYRGKIRVTINGTLRWIPFYD